MTAFTITGFGTLKLLGTSHHEVGLVIEMKFFPATKELLRIYYAIEHGYEECPFRAVFDDDGNILLWEVVEGFTLRDPKSYIHSRIKRLQKIWDWELETNYTEPPQFEKDVATIEQMMESQGYGKYLE